MTENSLTEIMQDMWGDSIEIMSVKKSINEHPTVYLECTNDEVTTVTILDLAGLDQLILLLQNARERISSD